MKGILKWVPSPMVLGKTPRIRSKITARLPPSTKNVRKHCVTFLANNDYNDVEHTARAASAILKGK